jgi:hypothetical protein
MNKIFAGVSDKVFSIEWPFTSDHYKFLLSFLMLMKIIYFNRAKKAIAGVSVRKKAEKDSSAV